MRNKTILIEIAKKVYIEKLFKKWNIFFNIKIKTYPHEYLNLSKGRVKTPKFSLCILNEIKLDLKNQGISDVKEIVIKKSQTIKILYTHFCF